MRIGSRIANLGYRERCPLLIGNACKKFAAWGDRRERLSPQSHRDTEEEPRKRPRGLIEPRHVRNFEPTEVGENTEKQTRIVASCARATANHVPALIGNVCKKFAVGAIEEKGFHHRPQRHEGRTKKAPRGPIEPRHVRNFEPTEVGENTEKQARIVASCARATANHVPALIGNVCKKFACWGDRRERLSPQAAETRRKN